MSQPYTYYFKPDVDGYSETTFTISDVFTPENGVTVKDTSRVVLQSRPLIRVEMQVKALNNNDAVRMENILRLIYQNAGVCKVPLWFSRDVLQTAASTSLSQVTILEAYSGSGLLDGFSYTAGGSTVYRDIMINVANYKYPSIHTVSAESSGLLTLGSAPDMNYPSNTEVCPLLDCRIEEMTEGQGRRYNAYGWSYTLTFEEIA